MGNTEGIISFLQTCFTVCLVLTILFFVVSIVLFFVFDIKTIFEIKTGRAKKKTIKEMQDINASTGRLRNSTNPKAAKKKLNQTDKMNYTQSPQPAYQNVEQQYSQTPEQLPGQEQSVRVQYEQSGAEEIGATDLLSNDSGATTVLQNTQYIPEVPSTAELGQKDYEVESEPSHSMKFTVVKEIMLVGSDETVD